MRPHAHLPTRWDFDFNKLHIQEDNERHSMPLGGCRVLPMGHSMPRTPPPCCTCQAAWPRGRRELRMRLGIGEGHDISGHRQALRAGAAASAHGADHKGLSFAENIVPVSNAQAHAQLALRTAATGGRRSSRQQAATPRSGRRRSRHLVVGGLPVPPQAQHVAKHVGSPERYGSVRVGWGATSSWRPSPAVHDTMAACLPPGCRLLVAPYPTL